MKYKIIIVLIILASIAGGYFFLFKHSSPQTSSASANAEPEKQTYHAMNGKLVDRQAADQRPIAVIIENYPDARPQSGLADADIVYEVLAEGGITRFLALFHSKDAQNIGPIRSARLYFADIANQWGALFAHVGGSDEALQAIDSQRFTGLADANEYFNELYFHRIQSKSAPHNVYTSIKNLRELIADRKLSQIAEFTAWQFSNDTPQTAPTASTISIDFSLKEYQVGYAYNTATNNYTRTLAGKTHLDANTNTAIQAKNIIVQFVNAEAIPNDPKLRISIDLQNGGKSILFKDGIVSEGTWKRQESQITYYDATGKQIELNRGQTWVELVPNDNPNRVTWK